MTILACAYCPVLQQAYVYWMDDQRRLAWWSCRVRAQALVYEDLRQREDLPWGIFEALHAAVTTPCAWGTAGGN